MSQGQIENQRPVCFVIMPISDAHGYEPGHFGRVYEHVLKPAIIEAGFIPVRADDTNKTDYIVVSIIQRVVQSAMVLCDYSARNPNVMYELGIRHAFNLPVALVRDKKTDKVFDIQGLRYTDYDESLRVDSVQKDISKIAKTLKETATGDGDGFNSVVQLAGIQAAKVPDQQKVSTDTQVLLAALVNIERRIDAVERKPNDGPRFFTLDGNLVKFYDTTQGEIGEDIYENGNSVGILVDIHPSEGKIFIKRSDGKVVVFSNSSIKSQHLSAVPF